jgi:hypothetical protein
LNEWLPFISDRKHFRQRFYTSYKSKVEGDVFIDDSEEYIRTWAAKWGPRGGKVLTIEYVYNRHVADLCHTYAADCTDTVKAWQTIVKNIQEIAES